MHRISLNQADLPAPLTRCPYVRSSAETPACVRGADEHPAEHVAPFLVGLNHQTAHVELRERFFTEQIDRLLYDLRAMRLAEAVLLFTCNRIEIYGVGGESAAQSAVAYLALRSGMTLDELRAHLYEARDLDAARHLMRVAAGLESMVLGEPQILGQVAQSLSRARATRTVGPQLTRLFEAAIRAGRRARVEGGLGHNARSISDAAVMLARAERPDLADLRALVIGAGRMAALTVKALQEQNVSTIRITSRNDERAMALARTSGAAAAPFESLRQSIACADVIFAATTAALPIVHAQDMPADLCSRLVIDLGMPRNVAPDAAEVRGVELRCIDNLKQVMEQHRRHRRGEVARVQHIIEEHLSSYRRDSAGKQMGPLIWALRQHVEALVDEEIRQVIRRLPSLDDASRATIEQMRRRIVGKLLHSPMMALKSHQSPLVARLVGELFNLKMTGEGEARAFEGGEDGEASSSDAAEQRDTANG